jgi:hypothetical protein
MSSLTTTTVTTKDGATNLTLKTGNTTGPYIVVGTGQTVTIGNSTANSFISNNSGVSILTSLNVGGAVVISNTLSMSGSLTVNSTGSFTNVSATGTISAARLTASNASLSTNTLSLGTSSITASGFSRLPNGLLYQWGSASATSTTGSVTFPSSFTTIYSIVATSNTAGTTYSPSVTSVSTTSASFRTANTTAATVYWMAIGV